MLETTRIELRLEKPTMSVPAGESAEQNITLVNSTISLDSFGLTMEGLPPEWYSFSETNVNLFPSENRTVTLKIELSSRVRPNQYFGRIIATSRNQPGVVTEIRLEIEVVAPLKIEARLQPHQATGFKARYNLILRNRSMSETLIRLQLSPSNPYCSGTFSPPEVPIAPGKSQVVKLKVQLRPKTTTEQAQQTQTFEVQIQPEWSVGNQPVSSPKLLVEGEYKHESRWAFIAQHPWLVTGIVVILLVILLWNILLLGLIQQGLLLQMNKVSPNGTVRDAVRIEQNVLTDNLQSNNPVSTFAQIQIRFLEDSQIVEINLKNLLISENLVGKLQVDPVKGDLSFKAGRLVKDQVSGTLNFTPDPKLSNNFPWMFLPPDKAVEKLNKDKLKPWLARENQRMVESYIEGNTLFLRLCPVNDSNCK